MGNVISLEDKRTEFGNHLTGPAHCIQCNHKWTVVAPVGTTEFECPECKTIKGVLTYPVESEHATWTCICGCNLFIISELTNVICRKCGVIQGTFNEP